MYNLNKIFSNSPCHITLKANPFRPLMDGDKKKPFTYHTINKAGSRVPWSPVKKVQEYRDPTPTDDKGKPSGPQKEAILETKSNTVYNFEEYETNEWERLAYIENWPAHKIFENNEQAPAALQAELADIKKGQARRDSEQQKLTAKINNVVSNYGTMFKAYSSVRTEVTAMVAELPVLLDSPFSSKYLMEMLPLVNNLAKAEFPNMVENPDTPPPPRPAAAAMATGS